MIFRGYMPVHSILPLVIAIPTLIVTLLWLAYLNFKNFRDGWPLWRRNLLGFAGAFVFIVVTSAALYHRAWEIFEPAEPAARPGEIVSGESARLADGAIQKFARAAARWPRLV